MASQETLQKVLLMLSAAYPTTELAEQTPGLYYRLLADIPDDVLEMATIDHISRSPFYPKVSELRGAVVRINSGNGHHQTAIEAWHDVKEAMQYLSEGRPKV